MSFINLLLYGLEFILHSRDSHEQYTALKELTEVDEVYEKISVRVL